MHAKIIRNFHHGISPGLLRLDKRLIAMPRLRSVIHQAQGLAAFMRNRQLAQIAFLQCRLMLLDEIFIAQKQLMFGCEQGRVLGHSFALVLVHWNLWCAVGGVICSALPIRGLN